MQAHGRTYEHELARDLSTVTPREVWCTTAGWSGNSGYDNCDLVIAVDPHLSTSDEDVLHLVEAKKRQAEGGKRNSAVFAGSQNDESGLDELRRFVVESPGWAPPILAVKFDHRRVIVLDARVLLSTLTDGELEPSPFVSDVLQPRLTPLENVSIRKPTLDEYESATASESDGVVLAKELNLPLVEERR